MAGEATSAEGGDRHVGVLTATTVVVASMVGTGIFTTTGLLLRDLRSPLTVLLAWLVGGVLASCGALSYAELGAALPRNGGEYQLLSRIYHPAVGFAAGLVSLVVGFSAPIAASALAFGHYVSAVIPGISPGAAGVALIVVVAVPHATHARLGGRVQVAVTVLELALVVAFVAAGLVRGDPRRILAGGEPLSAAATPAVAAAKLLGPRAGTALSAVIALVLAASVSAMLMAGPRVYQQMGCDHPRLAVLARRTRQGGPVVAVTLQAAIALAMIATSTFAALLLYIGFTLSLVAGPTVLGVFVLRRREPCLPRPARTLGYPVTPLLALAISGWMIVHALVREPAASWAGVATAICGLGLYALLGRPRRAAAAPFP